MNLHSQVALFYKLKGSNFRHVGCEIKSTINVIMYAEFDNVIEIDRNRQVLFDYSA
jgi:hypothetical protein